MAIDMTKERIISIYEAAEIVPPYRKDGNGEYIPTHPTRISRAIEKGSLEGLRLGDQWVTSVEALQRWGERSLTAPRRRKGNPNLAPSPAGRTAKQRERAAEQARKDIEKMGGL